MKVTGHPEVVDKLLKPYLSKYPSAKKFAQIGRKACEYAKRHAEYQNWTWNLRNAYGYAVVINGEVVYQEILSDEFHTKAVESTKKELEKVKGKPDGLYLANGMFYASFVEAKNYDVLIKGAIHAEELIEELAKKLNSK